MMIYLALCDDDDVFRLKFKEMLTRVLDNAGIFHHIYEFESGEDLLENYPKKLDILFLDIQMKQLNGIETAKEIRTYDTQVDILFLTSIIDYAPEGYEVRAYRYILKSVSETKLSRHILACIRERRLKTTQDLVLREKNSIFRIGVHSILYIETKRPNLIIHTLNGAHSIRMSIAEMETRLNELDGTGFYRCHNSYIISLRQVESLGSQSLKMRGGIEIPVSKYRLSVLKTALTIALGELI
ncbi:DNA-binding response regulator [Turicibacter sp. TS3]|nr:DNA-binding response regulator [Turicibacter sp. TS3]